MKVRTRMLIAFLAAGVLGLVYLLNFVDAKIKPVYLGPIEDDLVETSNLLASWIESETEGDVPNVSGLDSWVADAKMRPIKAVIHEREKTSMDLHIYVTDDRGMVIYDSQGVDLGEDYSGWRDVRRTLGGEYGARASWQEAPDGEGRRLLFYVAAPIRGDYYPMGVVSVGKPTPEVGFSIFQRMREEAFFGVYVAVFLGAILAWLFTQWVTRPIRLLTSYAQAVRDGRRVRAPKLGASDIGRLGRSFEEMRDALEGKRYVEEYVQTLTHEIKSPLSAIRGAAELLEEPLPEDKQAAFLGNIRVETQRIQRIVDRLLELSAIESRKGLDRIEAVDLSELIREVGESMRPQCEAAGITLTTSVGEGPEIRGERFLLRQALSNLLQNAIDFSPAGGRISVAVEDGDLVVRDTGPGVPDYAGERVFERFYSLQRPRSGRKSSGLGLSIVRQVAELHGARVSLSNGDGGGAVARLHFGA